MKIYCDYEDSRPKSNSTINITLFHLNVKGLPTLEFIIVYCQLVNLRWYFVLHRTFYTFVVLECETGFHLFENAKLLNDN